MLELTEANFNETVQNNETVIVDFWAPWCGPCRMFGPVFEKVAKNFPDVTFAKVNTEEAQSLAAALQVMSIPTLMAFRGGYLVFNEAGARDEKSFTEIVNKVKALNIEELKAKAAESQK